MLIEILKELPLLPFCCVCLKAIRINEKWIYLQEKEANEVKNFDNLSHGYCPMCHIELKKELEEFKRQRGLIK